ncbi:hypothetical protein [Streptomyces sp. NPDC050504]|uniref:hypothetical protein n=1 Tax=Streptomyces sp. NPDC050504 TaxID=3365618 RepID=UPI0037961B58
MTVQYTPLSNLPHPQPSDPADLPAHLKALADAVDGRTVMRFGDATARDAKLTAPVAGMVAWVGSPGRMMYYTGSAWVPVAPVPVFKVNMDDGDTASTAYTETLDNTAAMSAPFTVPASGQVIVTVGSYMRASAATPVTAYMSAVVRNAANAVHLAAGDNRSAAVTTTDRISVSSQFLVEGLAVGTVCTATPAYRAGKPDSRAYFDSRFIRIDPIP